MSVYSIFPKFANLFQGLDTAFGSGAGRWIKRPPRPEDWVGHLQGMGSGIGIAPLRPDNAVMFAAIDLDEPDFEAAREMQEYLPGVSWVERSKSGNAHVWVFFQEPIPAWVPMGVMRAATLAAEKPSVEVFPKNHDFSRVRLGNYINLPYHGKDRPILSNNPHRDFEGEYELEHFIESAEASRNDPLKWFRRAQGMSIQPPDERDRTTDFGTQRSLHICADHILSGDAGAITQGHQNMVLFMLARCLLNWEGCDYEQAYAMISDAAQEIFEPVPPASEVRRILSNVERARYTSTGCDDPLVIPFAHPDCPIAHPRSR